MQSKEKKEKAGAGERINQFIIECIFSKYFEEAKDNKTVVREEKVTV